MGEVDVEVISINKDSISHNSSSIPSIPTNFIHGIHGLKGLSGLSGAQLPNRDLVICGGLDFLRPSDPYKPVNHYFHYKEGSNQWRKVGAMKKSLFDHSSVWIDGRLLTTGSEGQTSHHEEFSFDGGVKMRKKLPMPLQHHTATIFDQNRIIVCGGSDRKVSQKFSN